MTQAVAQVAQANGGARATLTPRPLLVPLRWQTYHATFDF